MCEFNKSAIWFLHVKKSILPCCYFFFYYYSYLYGNRQQIPIIRDVFVEI